MKLGKIILVFVLTIGLINVPAMAAFKDMGTEHWAYDKVELMQEKGIISGFEDGTFRPDTSVTREQFASILVKALELKKSNSDIEFNDIESDRWSRKAIETASPYLTGYRTGDSYYFMPSDPAVREDMAVAIVKAKGLENKTPNYAVLNKFSDKNLISEGVKKYVAIAVEYGIMNGNANGTFNPLGGLTRAEITALMCNVMEKVAVNDVIEEKEYKVKVDAKNTKVYGEGSYKAGEEVEIVLEVKEGYEYKHIEKISGAIGIDSVKVVQKNNKVTFIFEMPAKDSEIEVLIEKEKVETYEVDVTAKNAKVYGEGHYEVGEDVEIELKVADGYEYKHVKSISGSVGIQNVDITENGNIVVFEFEMPADDVEIDIVIEKVQPRHEHRYTERLIDNGDDTHTVERYCKDCKEVDRRTIEEHDYTEDSCDCGSYALSIDGDFAEEYEIGENIEFWVYGTQKVKYSLEDKNGEVIIDKTKSIYSEKEKVQIKVTDEMAGRDLTLYMEVISNTSSYKCYETFSIKQKEYEVNVKGNNFLVEGDGDYYPGEQVKLIIEGKVGYEYSVITTITGVSITDVKTSGSNDEKVISFIMPDKDVTLTIAMKEHSHIEGTRVVDNEDGESHKIQVYCKECDKVIKSSKESHKFIKYECECGAEYQALMIADGASGGYKVGDWIEFYLHGNKGTKTLKYSVYDNDSNKELLTKSMKVTEEQISTGFYVTANMAGKDLVLKITFEDTRKFNLNGKVEACGPLNVSQEFFVVED